MPLSRRQGDGACRLSADAPVFISPAIDYYVPPSTDFVHAGGQFPSVPTFSTVSPIHPSSLAARDSHLLRPRGSHMRRRHLAPRIPRGGAQPERSRCQPGSRLGTTSSFVSGPQQTLALSFRCLHGCRSVCVKLQADVLVEIEERASRCRGEGIRGWAEVRHC